MAAKPAEPPKPEPPAEPKPIAMTISAPQVAVKLVSPGKGKRVPLRYSAKTGAKQQVELAIDFGADSAIGTEPPKKQVFPTVVLVGDVEATAADASSGKVDYSMKVVGTDAREVQGSDAPVAEIKQVLNTINGLVITSNVAPNGAHGETTMKLERGTPAAGETLELIRLTMPPWPLLPAEPIGTGAKWQATVTTRLADQVDVTQITDYVLVSKKGTTWTIKGTTKVSGKDQEVSGGGKITGISGSGTSEATLVDGVLYPTFKSSLETKFSASPAPDQKIQLAFRMSGAATPKK